jgi:hypothetical protein
LKGGVESLGENYLHHFMGFILYDWMGFVIPLKMAVESIEQFDEKEINSAG